VVRLNSSALISVAWANTPLNAAFTQSTTGR
jgi:hypothetical protein